MGNRRRAPGDPVDGLLLLDKPPGLSSNQALQQAKKLLGAHKAGHTGSLDPIATGLLPLCFGQATKVSGLLLDADKAYTVRVRLGASTDSGDRAGQVVSTAPVAASDADVDAALTRFRGTYDQLPPMFSALKHRGQPLYRLARQGVEVEREPRTVTVHRLERVAREGDLLTLEIECTKGFYVRSLAMDLGEALGCGAHVDELRRTAVGGLALADGISLEQLEALDTIPDRRALLWPADRALEHLSRVDLPGAEAGRLRQGQPARLDTDAPGGPGSLVRLYDAEGRFLGVGEVIPGRQVKPRRLFVPGA